MDNTTLPLHLSHVQKSSSIINRSHTLLHSTALIALIYYRIASFFLTTKPSNLSTSFSCLLVFTGELILSFIWFLGQAYRFRTVTRTVFPERLPENIELPAVDVFICTADPSKEPTLEVMNTVISAIALDYPPDKLHVYLSDDGGYSVTLEAMKEAWRFAKGYWVPFCRAYGIKTRCPEAYFLGEEGNTESSSGSEFMADRERVKEKYENFKSRVMRIRQNSIIVVNRDHTAVVEVQWQGLDGLQGPIVSGTGFYIKREALYANPIKDVDVMELKQYFGPSNEFIKSFGRHYKPKDHQHSASVTLMKETQYLASCAYENETKWGKEASPKQILPSIP
ncbi:hypothetical protein RHGRI_003556 [Rhododendron griersonianum]|uniref:Uncharacterized protein n=1 Tax=Rhododendron griersonianum TaxID=479676 RepID=A0AAV6L6A7_9ERIC|nr:hypothetical protein RHGRI_003556 [Rhododendron griersonianum]